MRLIICAVGRLKDGPERVLCDRYSDRIAGAGGAVALGPVQTIETPESKASRGDQRREEEAHRLLAAVDPAIPLIAFDERGKTISSIDFANHIAVFRDDGHRALGLMIGGPDGHGAAVRERASVTLSFGAMTLSHGLVRVVAAEQLYRAMTILSGHPYHRA